MGGSHAYPPTAVSAHPSSDLQLPRTSLNDTLCNLDRLTRTMMESDSSSDTTHDSLADSSYEFVSNAGSVPDGTESLISFSDSGVEGTSNTSEATDDGDPVTPVSGSEDEDESDSEGSFFHDRRYTLQASSQSSGINPRAAQQSDDTPKASTLTQGISSKTMSGYDKTFAQTHESSPQFPWNKHLGDKNTSALKVSPRFRLAPSSLRLHRPFRILYHGDLRYREKIVEKIAQALALSSTPPSSKADSSETDSSRFNVVQISAFGKENSSPQVTLIPSSGVELEVSCCQTWTRSSKTDVSLLEAAKQPPCLDHTYCDVSSRLTEPKNFKPDLVIFFHTFGEGQENRAVSDYMHSMICTTRIAGMGIPTLDVADCAAVWSAGPFHPFRDDAIHAVFRASLMSVQKIPIPIDLFCTLSASQINRNIACITNSQGDTRDGSVQKTCSLLQRVVTVWPTYKGLVVLIGLAIFSVMAPWLTTSFLVHKTSAPVLVRENCDIDSNLKIHSYLSTQPSSFLWTARRYLNLQSHTHDPSIEIGSDATQLAGVPKAPTKISAGHDGSGSSQVLQKGEMHLLTTDHGYFIAMPDQYSRLLRQPEVFVSVKQGRKIIPAELLKHNESHFALRLNGYVGARTCTVDVWTDSFPSLRQSFRLNERMPGDEHHILGLDRKTIDSGVRACLSTSKELSKSAQKEIALFRDQATGLVLSSSEWLMHEIHTKRLESSKKAAQVWNKVIARHERLLQRFQCYTASLKDIPRTMQDKWQRATKGHQLISDLDMSAFTNSRAFHRVQRRVNKISTMVKDLAALASDRFEGRRLERRAKRMVRWAKKEQRRRRRVHGERRR